MAVRRKPLEFYQELNYPFVAQVDESGEFFVLFPDLPGCMTGAESLDELPAMIAEATSLWLESEYESGHEMPLPTVHESSLDYSGKFNLRVPKALHRNLAENASTEGVSLNQYVLALLAARDARASTLRERVTDFGRGKATYVAEGREPYVAGARRTSPARKKKS